MSKELCIDPDNRAVYCEALDALGEAEVEFVLGGAFAVHFYTGLWRDTRDMDVFTTPERVREAINALLGAGFVDYGEMAKGDREWIFHARKQDITVDVIWKFANHIAGIEQEWLDEGVPGEFLGCQVLYTPLEELIYSKIFTLNRHRSDWPDVMRLVKNRVRPVRWDHLLDIIGEHWLLLSAVVDVFDWQYPSDMGLIPDNVRRDLRRRRDEYRPEPGAPSREVLLDPWMYTRVEDRCD